MTGTLINYYFFCKRKCWLSSKKINLEDNSEDVKIGKVLHELKQDKNSEIKIDDIKIDKIKDDFVIEYKKTNTCIESATMQLINYLYVLKNKGIYLDGKLEFLENKKSIKKELIIKLDEKNEQLLLDTFEDINILISKDLPQFEYCKKCNKCSYKDYCLI